jgi:hypothetical protein
MPQAVAQAQYEFGEHENKTIGLTAGRAQAWGVISLLLGVGQLALSQMASARASTFAMATQVAGGVVAIIVGAVFLGVATSLQSVVKSRGNDVALMMSALTKLSTALTIQIVVAIAGFAVGFVCGALGIT